MKKNTNSRSTYDAIVAGSGMGGVTAAALLAKQGFNVLILEAAVSPGGCSSSFTRQGYIFESGATTLIGFDENQPLRLLETELGITIEKTFIEPSMTVHMDGKTITRWQATDRWIEEVVSVFGEPDEQKRFWKRAKKVSDTVWKVSGRNLFFPPTDLHDLFQLVKNDPRDLHILPFSASSVKDVALECGISNPAFFQFLDEQLMISAQATSTETSFLFGAPALTYTNYSNYTIQGGMIGMIRQLIGYVEERGGLFKNRQRVVSVGKSETGSDINSVSTAAGHTYTAPIVVLNIPVWNLPEITQGALKQYFQKESDTYDTGWGAFTMGLVTTNSYPQTLTLHHQIHADLHLHYPVSEEHGQENHQEHGPQSSNVNHKQVETSQTTNGSVFVSFSHPEDQIRSKTGFRVLNVSTHVHTKDWFTDKARYDQQKKAFEKKIIRILQEKLPGFSDAQIIKTFSATPRTWESWVYRKKGRVGGIPQRMNRTILDWSPNKTPVKGVYLTGDTVYPGQGIPGVALSGILVAERIKRDIHR